MVCVKFEDYFEFSRWGYEKWGINQSNPYPYIFVGYNSVCIHYVDHLILWSQDEENIHELDIKISYTIVDLEQEEYAYGFLGFIMDHK